MNNGRGAEEALLASIRLLRNGGVQAYHGGHHRHRYNTRRIVEEVVAYDTANLSMRIVRLSVFQLAFVRRYLLPKLHEHRKLRCRKPGLLNSLEQRNFRWTMSGKASSRSRIQASSRSRWLE